MDKPKNNGVVKKRFEEERARRILKYTFPDKYGSSELSERPDIIAIEADIGVEVTNSQKKHIHEGLARAGSISGKNDEALNSYDLMNIEKKKVTSIKTPTGEYIGAIAFWGETHSLIEAYFSKLKNMNKQGYQIFNENNLFVFSWLIDQDVIDDFMEALKNPSNIPKEYKDLLYKFNYVYVLEERLLSSINLSTFEIVHVLISEEIMREITEASLEVIRPCS